jgi:hypothetical protein
MSLSPVVETKGAFAAVKPVMKWRILVDVLARHMADKSLNATMCCGLIVVGDPGLLMPIGSVKSPPDTCYHWTFQRSYIQPYLETPIPLEDQLPCPLR